MDALTIIGIAFVALTGGIGLGLGLRLLRIGGRARRDVKRSAKAGANVSTMRDGLARRRLSQPRGSRRTTSIHGLTHNGLLRHTDGSYTKAYRVEMENTLYADDATVDRNYRVQEKESLKV